MRQPNVSEVDKMFAAALVAVEVGHTEADLEVPKSHSFHILLTNLKGRTISKCILVSAVPNLVVARQASLGVVFIRPGHNVGGVANIVLVAHIIIKGVLKEEVF